MQPNEYIAKKMSIKFANCLNPHMDLSKHPAHWTFGFEQNIDESCVYKGIGEGKVVLLVLYVDDILLIGNYIRTLSLN